uniref:NADH-ubiquinone oxidoreductase chain 2 n=1 Tax=Goniodes dissimilis TaxID=186210 RepID=A0A9E9ENM8_9NEOP|nr:NADH dehydrogenase subunit 2 [Goniodes dissimilis]
MKDLVSSVSLLLISIWMVISSSSWLVYWVGMELSTLIFIPLLVSEWSSSGFVSSFKYFTIQSVGSSLFLFSVLLSEVTHLSTLTDSVMIGSMMMKLGLFPFIGWVFHVGETISWSKFFILSTVQEVIPLVTIFQLNSKWVGFISLYSLIILTVIQLQTLSVRTMVIISSLVNLSWITLASMISKESLGFYLMIYTLMVWGLATSVSTVVTLSTTSFGLSTSHTKSMVIMFSFMSMGIPPFGVFLPKVEILEELIDQFPTLSVLLLVQTSFLSMIYLKLLIKMKLSVTPHSLPLISMMVGMLFPNSLSLLVWWG